MQIYQLMIFFRDLAILAIFIKGTAFGVGEMHENVIFVF